MIAGYRPGTGLLHRAHPFTTVTIVAVTAVAAFALPPPEGPVVLLAAVALLAVLGRLTAVLGPAVALAAPFWLFLLLIHAVLGDDPERAVTLGARVTTMLLAFLVLLASVHPARLVDALVERGWPFSVAYLLSATLQAVPRLRARARAILDAQRCRGLRVGGSAVRRARALVPLAIPLVLGALAEAEERAFALEARAAHAAARRTALEPPPDSAAERGVRWMLLVTGLALVALRFAT